MTTSSVTNHILILGAGELGSAVTREIALLGATVQGTRVAVMLRPSAIAAIHDETHPPATGEKRRAADLLRAIDVELVPGDIAVDSIESLSAQFSRFDAVVSCVGFSAGAGTQLKLARAALASGIRRFIPWQFGVDYDVIGKGSQQDLFDEQLDVRALLRAQSNTEWLIISTGMFTSFLFEPAFGVVDLPGNVVHALGSWDTAVTVTTPEDIGRLTARILFAEPRLRNEVVFVAGDTLTYGALADTIDAVQGGQIRRVEWTTQYLDAELQSAPNDSMKKYRAVFAAGKGVAWDKRTTFNARHNIDVTTAKDWFLAQGAAGAEVGRP